jgi:hypothetical protein
MRAFSAGQAESKESTPVSTKACRLLHPYSEWVRLGSACGTGREIRLGQRYAKGVADAVASSPFHPTDALSPSRLGISRLLTNGTKAATSGMLRKAKLLPQLRLLPSCTRGSGSLGHAWREKEGMPVDCLQDVAERRGLFISRAGLFFSRRTVVVGE